MISAVTVGDGFHLRRDEQTQALHPLHSASDRTVETIAPSRLAGLDRPRSTLKVQTFRLLLRGTGDDWLVRYPCVMALPSRLENNCLIRAIRPNRRTSVS